MHEVEADHTTNIIKDSANSEDHIQCDQCKFLANSVPNLVNHIIRKHRHTVKTCNFCDYETESRNEIIDHISSEHGDNDARIEMANQIATLKESFERFETFKVELNDLINRLIGDSNAVKQELFMIRNNQANDPRLRDIDRAIQRLSALIENPPPSKPSSDASSNLSKQLRPSMTTESLRKGETITQQPKILFIGDSISSHANIEMIAEATESKIVTTKAYSAVYDKESNIAKEAAYFPKTNFTDVVPAEVVKDDFEHLILQAGSVDISNLKTSQNAEIHMEYFRQQAVISAQNIFNAGINALVQQPSLKKVVIFKQIPRYDPTYLDPLQLKQALSQLFNRTLTELWINSPYKERIHIGSHNMECSGSILTSRYKDIETGKFDGVHLFGSSGSKFYTLSILNILQSAGLTSENHNYHLSCPQSQHRNSRVPKKGNSLRGL